MLEGKDEEFKNKLKRAMSAKDEELKRAMSAKDQELKRAISEIAELRRRLPRAAEEEVSEHAGRAGGD